MKIFPKVYYSQKTQKVFFQTKALTDSVSIKIQGMEYYTIPHSPIYRIDEEERYPYLPMTKAGDGLFAIEYAFKQEQKYSVKVKIGEKIVLETHIYAVDEDLAKLQPLKGDTHLHSNRSDGEGTPFEVGCQYRAAGFDFIAVTDHHKFAPSIEAKTAFEALTDEFTVFYGEEVHNRDMGYFHIVNFGGEISVNEPILADPDSIEAKVQEVLNASDFTGAADPYACAYRIFVAEEIRKGGGLAIMSHPYWDCFGEYNMEADDFRYLLTNGCFDAVEVLAGCDRTGNGDNLQTAYWADLRTEGIKIPVVGASDSHSCTSEDSLFNRHFSIVFADGKEDIKNAIKDERSVAVNRRSATDFFVVGKYRYVKYARFLLEEYAPAYEKLTEKHAAALSAAKVGKRTAAIRRAEEKIAEFKKEFFVF